ncbi:hypothetical protein AB835_06875 [Candidatus Endobugula sertula]|uniref:L-tryptophan decarboxylase PsiD-like domain-containing protein n=1 Tax=Candidatus Endobugula sertula TaxID=62101 RepID=A0A1D2QQP7_9GAMM|nr:hypothetical protein AB835_06875 [Candidatus Endobugula sertula]
MLRKKKRSCLIVGGDHLQWNTQGTNFGYTFFSNQLVNQHFKRILNYWGYLLTLPDSRYVLIHNYPHHPPLREGPTVYPWLSGPAKQEMVAVACQLDKDPASCKERSFESFFVCDTSDEYYGFKSWDDFFTREFKAGQRPVAEGDYVIANPCEAAPIRIARNVSEDAKFWLKQQPYSLRNMMNFDPLAKEFVGGTVYQSFLSALSYHRWHSPVKGIIEKAFVVNGAYFLENLYEGFANPDGDADPAAAANSQPFLSAVATRAVIFIRAENDDIGLMCFIGAGMAEVSSCDITVTEGQKVNKGDQLGMFHFGGSTKCLVFKPDVEIEFDLYGITPGVHATNIPVCKKIATVKPKVKS